jgi:alkylated DNA nucleotide flippase Atl1
MLPKKNQPRNKQSRITPYWHTLKAGGLLNEKYPGGAAAQKKRLLAEGHTVTKKGKTHVVANLEQSLFDFD